MITYLRIFNEFISNGGSYNWCNEWFIDYKSMKRVLEIRNQLKKYLIKLIGKKDVKFETCNENYNVIKKCLCSGLFMNAARLTSDGSYRTIKDGRSVYIHPNSILLRVSKVLNWVIYYDVELTSEEYMREISFINPLWLLEIAPHFYECKDERILNEIKIKMNERSSNNNPTIFGPERPKVENDVNVTPPLSPSNGESEGEKKEKRKIEHINLFDDHLKKILKF